MPALRVQIAQVEEQQKSDPPCRAGAASRSATRPRWIASSPSGVSGAHVQNPAELDKLRATEPLWGTKIVDPRAMDIRRRRRPATRRSAKRASTANTPCGQTGELARQRAEMVRNYVFSNSKLDRIFSSFYVFQCFLTFRKPCPEKCKHILGGMSGKLRRI